MLAECIHHEGGIRIGAVPHDVPFIDQGDGLQNLRMHARIVVAGEAAQRLHSRSNLADAELRRGSSEKTSPWESARIPMLQTDAAASSRHIRRPPKADG